MIIGFPDGRDVCVCLCFTDSAEVSVNVNLRVPRLIMASKQRHTPKHTARYTPVNRLIVQIGCAFHCHPDRNCYQNTVLDILNAQTHNKKSNLVLLCNLDTVVYIEPT